MPDLVEQMYCSQQIFIPPNLPSILKKYAKAAIRTQPGDLLIWSSAYFRALAAGIPPPTKERIEYPPVETPSGLSPGFLKVLINQIGKGEIVSKEVLEERWRGVCLNPLALQDLLAVGMFDEEVHWLEFLAICAGTLQPSLTKTMMQLCELLTDEPQGGSAAIPVSMFLNLYKYLAKLDCGPVNTLEEYEKTLKEDSEIKCAAENLEPQEEAVERAIPNIDWNTAIGDLQERDSDKTIETNPSDAGMMVWPDIKPEKEEIDEDPVMEKEVLSDEGLEVFTEVDIPLVQDEIKIFPEKTMEEVTDASGNEGNIFAPQIDSFADLVEAESAPIEEFNEEDKLVVEASSDAGDESSPQIPVEQDAAPTAEVATPGTPQQQEEVDDGSKITSDSKSKKEVVIELLVKKDSEMMLLPTPKTSDVMLYNDNECEKCTLKVSPTQLLSDRMSLVDVHVAVPVDETVVEVVERHRYPKWMNIPGIGPVVPDHIIEEAEKYFVKVAELQEGMVMPRNMKHFHCPPLEMSPDCVEENKL